MKVIHSSIFRAVCAIIVGVLLIQYREQTVTWITIAIGVLFSFQVSSPLPVIGQPSAMQRRCRASFCLIPMVSLSWV